MYAVVKTGGKQYRVAKDDIIRIERLPGQAGEIVTLSDVLMVGEGGDVTVGAPFIAGASVAGEIVEQTRAAKIIVFKKRRRQNYRRKKGHRQMLTVLKVTEILTDGAKPSKKAAAKKPEKTETKAEAPKAETTKAKAEAKTEAPKAKATKAEAPKPAKKPAAPAFDDDVSLISGVGPKLKEKLEGYGITSLKEIAKMSKANLAKMDEALELHGRATRDEWVEQAKELIAGKPPRKS
ncbi:MAG TPA: 50S ribosomal protein L21 [Parvularculaceae bacterium]|nr:50S ribosomal protein L21 [Parvularculaceae bacterium]